MTSLSDDDGPGTGGGGRSAVEGEVGELLRKGAASFLLRPVTALLAVATHLAISRVWGASALGLYSLAVTVTYSAALFARAGTDGAAVRFVAEGSAAAARSLYRRVLAVALPLSTGLAAGIWLSAPWLAGTIFGKAELVGPLRALAAAIPMLNLLTTAAACFQGRRRIVLSTVLLGPLPPALTLALLAAAAARGAFEAGVPAYARALALAMAGSLAALLWWWLAGRGGDSDPSTAPGVRRLLGVATPMFASSSLYWLLTSTDTFVLGVYRSSSEIGLYRGATSVALVISFATSALHVTAAPMFARAYWRKRPVQLERLVRVTARVSFAMSGLAALVLFAFARPILRLFGEPFVDAVPALIVYGSGLVVSAAFGPGGVLLNMVGEERALYRILLAAAAFNLALLLALVPRWGIVGAAASTAASACLWNALAAHRARLKLGHSVGLSLWPLAGRSRP